MKIKSFFCSFSRIACSSLLGLMLILSAGAQTVTYNFNSPQFTFGETTPLLNRSPNIGSPLFKANFASTPTVGGLSIDTFMPNVLFSGQMLYVPVTPPDLLTISLNTPSYGVTLDFATLLPGRLDLLSASGNTSQNSSFVGGSFEGGTLSFNSATPFTSFQLIAYDLLNAQTLFAIDNMTLNLAAVPEPAVGVLFTLAIGAFACVRRVRK